MKMRRSRVLERMRSGKVATCVKLNIDNIRNVELASMFGLDCLWIDMEHVPSGIEMVEKAVLASKAHDTDILTRVARGSYSNLIKPLEADSTGIMVPHVMSYEDAKSIVYYTKFHPIGRRPLDGGNADGAYTFIDATQYIEDANNERFVIIQIEDPEPMKDLKKICQLKGLDMIFFGPADFTQGAGIPLDFNNPIVLEARKKVASMARRYGKFAGTVGGAHNFDELVKEGYTFISTGADVVGLGNYYESLAKTFRDYDIVDLE